MNNRWDRYLALFLLLFTACSPHKQPVVPQPPLPPIHTERKLPSLNGLNVKGKINLQLHTGRAQSSLLLTGDPRDLAQLHVGLQGRVLSLSFTNSYPCHRPVYAEVTLSSLRYFRYEGTGRIRGHNLITHSLNLYLDNQGTTDLSGNLSLQRLEIRGNGSTRLEGISGQNLMIHLKDNPRVQLSGRVNLNNLNIEGDAALSLYWIKSYHLTIQAKNKAHIELAGTVNRLEVELWGNAQFKGRYLRASRSFIKTHDRSLAEISTINHQSSLAMDASDIFYYNIPHTRGDWMTQNGSVLKMREFHPLDKQDFNQYNKHYP